jgi:hypothetical protein
MKSFSFWNIRPYWELQATSFVLASFLPFFFFGHYDEGDMLHRNVGLLSRDYTVLYHKRQNSSTCISLKVKLSEPEADLSTFLS